MNTVDLERLKEKEDDAVKMIDSWPRIFQLLVYRQLYAFGIRISNIDSEIEKELKKSDWRVREDFFDLSGIPPDKKPIAVEFYLVKPFVAFGQFWTQPGIHGLDESDLCFRQSVERSRVHSQSDNIVTY